MFSNARPLALSASLWLAATGSAWPSESDWIADFDAARAKAREEKKDLLIEFTGSDWCPPCMRLAKQVFHTDEFQAEATKQFVLVVVDKPRDQSKLTPELWKQSGELHERFAVNQWPTVFLADAEGRPYARSQEQGAATPKEFLLHVASFDALRAQRTARLTEAEAGKGIERARALDAAMRCGGPFLPCATLAPWIDEVVSADADGEAGLKAYWTARREADRLEFELPPLGHNGKWDEMASRIDAFLAPDGIARGDVIDPPVRQKALYWQGLALSRLKKLDVAKVSLDAAAAIDAKSEFGKRAADLSATLPW